jgi:hypothetical protein
VLLDPRESLLEILPDLVQRVRPNRQIAHDVSRLRLRPVEQADHVVESVLIFEGVAHADVHHRPRPILRHALHHRVVRCPSRTDLVVEHYLFRRRESVHDVGRGPIRCTREVRFDRTQRDIGDNADAQRHPRPGSLLEHRTVLEEPSHRSWPFDGVIFHVDAAQLHFFRRVRGFGVVGERHPVQLASPLLGAAAFGGGVAVDAVVADGVDPAGRCVRPARMSRSISPMRGGPGPTDGSPVIGRVRA